MTSLGINWFAEGRVDFEHKKYVLLDYLQQINRCFGATCLYPTLPDLMFHYNNLLHFKNNKHLVQQSFPQKMTGADVAAVKITYQKIVQDDSSMREIEQIITYAINKMDPAVKTGQEIYGFVEQHLNIDPVGVIPLIPDYGYFTLRNGSQKGNWVYEYTISIFEGKDDEYRALNTKFVAVYDQTLVNTPEYIKRDLIYRYKHLPNPAVYHVECDMTFPLEQTLLPIAKRSLAKYIASDNRKPNTGK